jgi:hypothetical protein
LSSRIRSAPHSSVDYFPHGADVIGISESQISNRTNVASGNLLFNTLNDVAVAWHYWRHACSYLKQNNSEAVYIATFSEPSSEVVPEERVIRLKKLNRTPAKHNAKKCMNRNHVACNNTT